MPIHLAIKLITMTRIILLFSVLFLLFTISCKKDSSVNPGGGASNPVPVAGSILPAGATAGDPAFTITVSGSSFINGSVINWNGTALTTTFVNATQLTALVPGNLIATAGTAAVTVFNAAPAGGTSGSLTFTISNISTNPVPAISSISPASVTVGAAAFTMTVNGNNFIASSVINWNGTVLTTTFVNSLQLTCLVPASLLTVAGNGNVTVINSAPGGGTSNNQVFTISPAGNNPTPSLQTIVPDNVNAGSAAFTLTVNGSGFINSSVVKWNGTALTTTYINNAQLTAMVPASLVTAAGIVPVTVFNTAPGGGTSGVVNFTINPPGTTAKKFLFDATKAETAGNADWVIDEDGSNPQRIPTPAQSTVTASTPETYWTGAISAWGIALVKLGHTVETLPSGAAITFGNAANPQDLSNYNVFVVDEPNTRFTAAEKTAILNFVNSGGGLFMVSDHTASDRDNDGWDSPAIWNDLMTNNTVANDPFGFSVDLTNISQVSTNVLSGNAGNVILHGSQGNVTQLSFNNGATLTLTGTNPNAQGLVWQNTFAQNNTRIMSASSTYGTGRIFAVTDSSPVDDGSGAPGNTVYVGWSLYSHTQLFMNASLWLAKLQ